MFTALRIGLVGALLWSSADLPDISGEWSGEEWGTVALKQTNAGEYAGTYTENIGPNPCKIRLKWSETEGRFNGTWSEGEDRFGELSIRLVGDEIRGALTTDPKSRISHARPRLADVTWTRGPATAKQVLQPVAAPKEPGLPLDLTAFYQTPASAFERIRAYPWRAVPRGSKTLGNVPLAIDGMLCLWGEANAKSGAAFAEKVDDIPVNRSFDTLYVYHATFYPSRDGSPVYHLTLHYANGTSSMTTICYGAACRDWWQPSFEQYNELTDLNSKMVWRADSPDSKADNPIKLRFFITAITNPRPELEVKSISLTSAKGNSAGCILAMTTGPAGLLKVGKSSGK